MEKNYVEELLIELSLKAQARVWWDGVAWSGGVEEGIPSWEDSVSQVGLIAAVEQVGCGQ